MQNMTAIPTLPYLTLPPRWTGSYTCPALRPYQFCQMRVTECNHLVRFTSVFLTSFIVLSYSYVFFLFGGSM